MGSRWVGLGRYSARIDPTGSGKPMEALPDPKTAIKQKTKKTLLARKVKKNLAEVGIHGGNKNRKKQGKGGLGNESGLDGSVRAHIRPESIPPGLGSLWKPSRTPKRP